MSLTAPAAASRLGWGAFGGSLPFVLQFIRTGLGDVNRDLPTSVGTFYLAAVVLSIALGALASRVFESNHEITAIYNGASAPLALAFIGGLNPHTLQLGG